MEARFIDTEVTTFYTIHSEGKYYLFGPFLLDCQKLELKNGEKVICKEERVIRALQLLAIAYPNRVDKETLIKTLWPGQVVTELSLTRLISDIRQLLGDSGKNQAFIKTDRGKGFRFVAPITIKERPIKSVFENSYKRRVIFYLGVKALVMCLIGLGTIVYFQIQNIEDKNESLLLPIGQVRLGTIPVRVKTTELEDEWIELGVSSLVSGHLAQYKSISSIPIEDMLAVTKNIDFDADDSDVLVKAIFNQVCKKLGCTHLLYLEYIENDSGPILHYCLIDEKGIISKQDFFANNVIEAAYLLTQHLDQRLLSANTPRYAYNSRYSSSDLANRSYAIGTSDLINGNLPEAIANFKLAIDRDENFMLAKLDLAAAYTNSNQYEQARDALDAIDLDSIVDHEIRGQYFRKYSLLSFHVGDKENAVEFSAKAIKEFRQLNDPVILAIERANYAAYLQELFRFSDALENYRQAEAVFKRTGAVRWLAILNYNRAEMYMSMMDGEQEALRQFRAAWEGAMINELSLYALVSEVGIARAKLKLGELDGLQKELTVLADKFSAFGMSDFYFGCKIELIKLKLKQGLIAFAEEEAVELRSEMDKADRIAWVETGMLIVETQIQMEEGNFKQADLLYKKMANPLYAVDPKIALLGAEIAHRRGDNARALTTALEVKQQLGKNWTAQHQFYLDVYNNNLGALQ